MKKIHLTMPSVKDVVGPMVAEYPEGYRLPFTVAIREAYVRYRKEFLRGAEFTIPGFGVLRTTGRDYSFTFENDYWQEKGYPTNCAEGKW